MGRDNYKTPTNRQPKKPTKNGESTSESGSFCSSDEQLAIVQKQMNYLVGLFLAPDFKKMINWLNLKSEDVTLEESTLEAPTVRNFVILTALKIQQLKGELKETKELNQALSKQH